MIWIICQYWIYYLWRTIYNFSDKFLKKILWHIKRICIITYPQNEEQLCAVKYINNAQRIYIPDNLSELTIMVAWRLLAIHLLYFMWKSLFCKNKFKWKHVHLSFQGDVSFFLNRVLEHHVLEWLVAYFLASEWAFYTQLRCDISNFIILCV